MPVPAIRLRAVNDAPVRRDGRHVLYWMIANRRLNWNVSLDRALEWAGELGRPLIVLEALRCDYPWASDRLHRFVLQGMADNARTARGASIVYYPYVEPARGAGEGLLAALAADACVVVTDDFPCFFLPRMVASAGEQLRVRLEAVDSNGLWPLRGTERVFARAVDFRRHLQRELAPHLQAPPRAEPLHAWQGPMATLPAEVEQRWPRADEACLAAGPETLARLPVDHTVGPALLEGGACAARARLKWFLDGPLDRYGVERSQPDVDASSGLSPYLHFGQLSAHEVLNELAEREDWSTDRLSTKARGRREGWWGMTPSTESFLDELVTWRELGYNFCTHREDYDQFESLPEWAQASLAAHAGDRRPHQYSLEQFQAAATHDALWNAAQRQLVQEGRLHNYLRMLWGKKILEWSASPREALATLIELNNRYAVDGRNPNSYSGIFWTLGRYDRPWAPRRPIFGVIRYMSSENTARKLKVRGYLAKYSGDEEFSLRG